ncbi:ABC transporter ATP-binding protein/permease [Sporolactobacillus shoreicorticis]|uniref:ABC transporter ATP-binding protein n=1 Tax=Sporolactobacillus shoreicorticis TaxID=1923877 RepID=A0ABW5S312_9BACL|nr:ABC transporter ATP-binding protein [Sporolactobacillus shoreicorticis]MCO7124226.1 ABC transporter ATP-binding protein/permease [Sporolactobacillus shoreicorticis]
MTIKKFESGINRKVVVLICPLIKKHWKAYSGLTIIMLINLMLTLLIAAFFGRVMNAAVNSRLAELTQLIPWGSGLLLVSITANYCNSCLQSAAVYGIERDLKKMLYQHILYLRAQCLTSLRSGDLLSRFSNDINKIENMLGSRLVDLVRMPLIYITVFIYLLHINITLALVSWLVAPIAVTASSVFGFLIRRNSRMLNEVTGDNSQLINETLQGFFVIRSFVMEHLMLQRNTKQNDRIYHLQMKNAKLSGLYYVGGEIAGSLTLFVTLCLGAYFISNGSMSVGALVTFITLIGHMVYPLTGAAGNWVNFQRAAASAERIQEILDEPLEREQSRWQVQSPFVHMPIYSLEFRDLTFGYDAGKPVLQHFNLKVPADKKTAIVGLSGAGKTTLFSLLLRLYEPQEGMILINGLPIQSFSLKQLRTLIAHVPQETFLFNGTVRENLLLGSRASESEMICAARAATIDPFIRSLPEGYDTVIGERGMSLSGGQKQRIAIARALIKNAPLLLLDEATSALDNKTEAQVKVSLDRLMEKRTTLVIAHRLTTIQNADHIVVMEKGRIVQEGTHHYLMMESGLYRRLQQMGNTTPILSSYGRRFDDA